MTWPEDEAPEPAAVHAVVKKKLDDPECGIRFVIRGQGAGEARFWTCDFTNGYIDINASYRT